MIACSSSIFVRVLSVPPKLVTMISSHELAEVLQLDSEILLEPRFCGRGCS